MSDLNGMILNENECEAKERMSDADFNADWV